MLSESQVARLIEAQEYSILIDRILSNGRCRSESARRLLRDSGCALIAATALSVQRLAELTYRPTPMADGLVQHLLTHQQPNGCFIPKGPGGQARALAVTATVIRALLTWQAQCDWCRRTTETKVDDAIERGLQWLAVQFHGDNPQKKNAVGWAVVLWQLGDVDRFRLRVETSKLLNQLHVNDAEAFEDDLCRYAAAMAA